MPAETAPTTTGALSRRSNTKAAITVSCAFAVFSATDALVKLLAERFPVLQVTYMVTGAALLMVITFTMSSNRLEALWPRRPGHAFLRALLLAGDTLLIYYAFAALPLAEAYALSFLSPVLVAIFAYVFLGERLSAVGWAAVLLGFVGVVVALRPGVAPMNAGHAEAIGSALFFALSLVVLRRTEAKETDMALVATVLGVLAVSSLVIAAFGSNFTRPEAVDMALVLMAGFLLFCGHTLLVRAFRIGDASVLAPFQYSQILWGCLYGALLFGAPIEIQTLVGGAIIIVSGWLVLK